MDKHQKLFEAWAEYSRQQPRPAPTGNHHTTQSERNSGQQRQRILIVIKDQKAEIHYETTQGDQDAADQPWYKRLRQWTRQRIDANAVIAFGTIILGGLAFGGLILTKQSVNDNKRAFQATQRPDVSLGRKDGILAEFAEPEAKGATEPVGIKLYFQNAGQAAALTPNVGILSLVLFLAKGASPSPHSFQREPDPFGHFFRSRIKRSVSSGSGGGGGAGSIAPQSEFVHMSPRQVSEEQLDALRDGQRLLILSGIIEYCDVLGIYYCRLFDLSYQGKPFNTFYQTSEMDCSNLYSYPNRPRAADEEFLLPCEQPDEREARENREREELIRKAFLSPTSPSAVPNLAP